eukprot:2886095-Pyramimonas_sp.AAC.1
MLSIPVRLIATQVRKGACKPAACARRRSSAGRTSSLPILGSICLTDNILFHRCLVPNLLPLSVLIMRP